MPDQEAPVPTSTPMPGDPEHGPIVRHGRHPWVILLLALPFTLSGAAGLFTGKGGSPNMAAALGEWLQLWYAGLVVGSVVTLVGLAIGGVPATIRAYKRWRGTAPLDERPLAEKPLWDVMIERIGMVLLATVFGVLFAALLNSDYVPAPTVLSVLMWLGFSIASVWRAVQIAVDLRRLQKFLAKSS